MLFRRYARPVRNVGQRILRDKAEADDLVQEYFSISTEKVLYSIAQKGPRVRGLLRWPIHKLSAKETTKSQGFIRNHRQTS